MSTVLAEALERYASLESLDGDAENESNHYRIRRIHQERQELEIKMANLQQALDHYIEAADELQPPPEGSQMVKIEQNIDNAHTVRLKGQNRLTELSLILRQNEDLEIPTSPLDETNKYDNQDAVVNQLLQELQDLQPASTTTTDQMNTLDKIVPIISQLERKGENTNTQQMRRTVLKKFSDKIQRAMLKKKTSFHGASWTTKQLLQDLQDFFNMEAQIENIRGTIEESNISTPPVGRTNTLANNRNNRTSPCFYCNESDHAPRSCSRYPTIDQRLQLISQRNLCHNCGSGEHRTKNCTRGACRQCKQKGHHTSICRKSLNPQASAKQPVRDAPQKTHTEGHATKKMATGQNSTVTAEKSSRLSQINDQAILHHQDISRSEDLLVGQARVWNVRRQEFEDVHIMLDTGANRSFITNDYAEHLGLEKTGQLQLIIHTFGDSSPNEQSCEKAQVEIEDRQGVRHKFELAKIDFIMGDLQRTPLSELDRQYLQRHNIKLSISPQILTLQTPILLGCGDLFSLFDHGFGYEHILPSGIRLLRSKLGYLSQWPATAELQCRKPNLTGKSMSSDKLPIPPPHPNPPPVSSPTPPSPVTPLNPSTHPSPPPSSSPSSPLTLRPHPSTKATHTVATSQQNAVQEIVDWKRFSSVAHATSAFSYALRWLNRIVTRLNPDLRDSILGSIPQLRKRYNDEFTTVPERNQAVLLLIRNHQRLHVEGKINPVKERLVPIMDSDGLLRCRGRLHNSDLSKDSKQPILLGPQTSLATLVIQDAHKRFHLGTAHTMAEVNQNKEGVVRDVELILANKRTTRRPINLIVPLELDGEEEETRDGTKNHSPSYTYDVTEGNSSRKMTAHDSQPTDTASDSASSKTTGRYYLRSRSRNNYVWAGSISIPRPSISNR
ncbi:zinc knuckle [Ostertagia ostertagi]